MTNGKWFDGRFFTETEEMLLEDEEKFFAEPINTQNREDYYGINYDDLDDYRPAVGRMMPSEEFYGLCA